MQTFFGNPLLTWTEHSKHNNQQLLAMYVHTEYTWYTTPKYQYWFRAILGRFSTHTKKSEWDLDPPTHFHSNLGFLEKKFFAKPLTKHFHESATVVLTFPAHSCKRQLRLSNSDRRFTPGVKTNIGCTSSSDTRTILWNSIPDHIESVDSWMSFWHHSKSHLPNLATYSATAYLSTRWRL